MSDNEARAALSAAAPQPRIGLVVGNGLAKSYCSHIGNSFSLDPSEPLGWQFNVPGPNDMPWAKAFPTLSAVLNERLAQSHVGEKSYMTFKGILERLSGFDRLCLVVEARHFLAFAYSYFQEELDKHHRAAMTSWCWYQWLETHFPFVPVIFSFNYDLTVESCCFEVAYRNPAARRWLEEVDLWKPHGSIDLDADPRHLGTTVYPMDKGGIADFNEVPTVKLHPARFRAPRSQATLVLPEEASQYMGLSWIRPGYERWHHNARTLTHCVFVGMSYAECDRVEIDFMLRQLGRGCQVISVNPSPSKEFEESVRLRGLRHEVWTSPQAIS